MEENIHQHVSLLSKDVQAKLARVIKASWDALGDETCSVEMMHAIRDTEIVKTLTPQEAVELGYTVGRLIAEIELSEASIAVHRFDMNDKGYKW